jgi:hypothetical protein
MKTIRKTFALKPRFPSLPCGYPGCSGFALDNVARAGSDDSHIGSARRREGRHLLRCNVRDADLGKFATLQILDVHLPTVDRREIVLRRC